MWIHMYWSMLLNVMLHLFKYVKCHRKWLIGQLFLKLSTIFIYLLLTFRFVWQFWSVYLKNIDTYLHLYYYKRIFSMLFSFFIAKLMLFRIESFIFVTFRASYILNVFMENYFFYTDNYQSEQYFIGPCHMSHHPKQLRSPLPFTCVCKSIYYIRYGHSSDIL